LASEKASPLQWNEIRQFTVKPGLTGPWLVQKRGSSQPNGSLWSDVAILLRSAARILATSRRAGKEENHARTG
ncbi:MAG: hypothetical protein V3T83_10355, partial [Acidobacteriota bacterium]